jgi:uncharacterized protein YjbJ (UPF0337 family)
MNKDQVKGQVKNIAGKVQEATGKLVDSKSQEVKGVKLQVEGSGPEGLWRRQGGCRGCPPGREGCCEVAFLILIPNRFLNHRLQEYFYDLF